MTQSLGPALASPVVSYSAALGETLVYSANEAGEIEAMNLANGQIVWSYQTFHQIVATPLVVDGALWVATQIQPKMIKLNADTGALDCTLPVQNQLMASPTYGVGPGGQLTIYEGEMDGSAAPQLGPMLAINAANCALDFSSFPEPTGVATGPWDPIAYGVDAGGRALAIMGTSNPDDSVYAVDAVTGAAVWRVTSPATNCDCDFGAGANISPPGANGVADGVVYIPGKDGVFYAIDLTTGSVTWTFNYAAFWAGGHSGVTAGSHSTPALSGTTLVFGTTAGLIALDVTTQQVLWSLPDAAEVLGAPVITGPAGSQVVVYADMSGAVRVVSLADGSTIYATNLGGYITASLAVSSGNILVTCSNGFVYDLGLGGANASAGTSAITSPGPNQVLPNPGGSLILTGTASDPVAVGAVHVAVQLDGTSGKWWNAATSSWAGGPYYGAATLDAPGSAASGWTFSIPVPAIGATLRVYALEQSESGESQVAASTLTFAVQQVSSVTVITPQQPVAYPGQLISVTGRHFGPNEKVTLAISGAKSVTVKADATGSIIGALTVPNPIAPFGPALITGTGLHSGDVASYPINVTGSWSQPSQNPMHTGLQPNDASLGLASPQGKYSFNPAWTYHDGAAVTASPAVFDNVVYIGDAAGILTAIQLQTGAPQWTVATPGAITASPVYDNNVVFVASGSQIEAVSASTGAVLWQAATPGVVQGAVSIAGNMLYLATTGGTIEAVNELDGSTVWQASVPGPVTAAMSVDTVQRIVVVGDASGSVTALAMATGAQLWQSVTGSAISVSPTIAANRVYLGAADGSVRSWNETTGEFLWSTTLVSAVTTTAALNAGYLIVGVNSGKLYALDPVTGAVLASVNVAVGGRFVSVQFTGAVAITSNRIEVSGAGGSAYTFRYPSTWGTVHQDFVLATTGGLSAGPVVVNNELIVAGQDGIIYCDTPAGTAPV